MKHIILIILAFSLNACIPDISGDTNTYNDSTVSSNNNNTNTDSYNTTYTEAQEELIAEGYFPEVDGVCRAGYDWCSIEKKCLPESGAGSICSVHEDDVEAEASELDG